MSVIAINDNVGAPAKKERWMRKGNTAIVNGERVTITDIEDTRIGVQEYVYILFCQHKGNRTSTRYYPHEVSQDIN